ncbi:MAG: type II 3-dehydroquinate dehydratase [Muribaculaceae bacterium]|nr:type II 3-dehydroquinate dehydratase [Muribaculaceae bacterium]
MKILVINGPNLNLLGRREPEVYGTMSFDDYYQELMQRFPEVEFSYVQSNHEGVIIDELHMAWGGVDGVVLNAGAYSHTSLAIADAIASIEVPVVEVHISNVFARESFRHHSMLSAVCAGVIVGFGLNSYALAVQSLIDRMKQ